MTKPITMDLTDVRSASTQRGDLCGFRTTLVIRRADYGITYMPRGLGNEVTLMIGIEGKKKK